MSDDLDALLDSALDEYTELATAPVATTASAPATSTTAPAPATATATAASTPAANQGAANVEVEALAGEFLETMRAMGAEAGDSPEMKAQIEQMAGECERCDVV